MDRRPVDEDVLKGLEKTLEHLDGAEKKSTLFRMKILKLKTSGKAKNLDFVPVSRKQIANKILREKNLLSGYGKLISSDPSLKASLLPKYEYAATKIYFLNKQLKAAECMGNKGGTGEKTSGMIELTVVDYESDPMFETHTLEFFVDLGLRQSVTPSPGMKITLDLTNNCEIEIVVRAKDEKVGGMLFFPCESFTALKSTPVYMLDFQGSALLLTTVSLTRKKNLVRRNAEIFVQFKAGHELVSYHNVVPSYCCVCDNATTFFSALYRCARCKFTLHKRCADYILFQCAMNKTQAGGDDFTKRYNIPHKVELTVSSGMRWCGHCGSRIASKKKAHKCTVCAKNFHNACEVCIFPSCGIQLDFRMAVAQFKPPPPVSGTGKPAVSIQDFTLVKVLGRGSFGKVMLARHRSTEKITALKIVKKESVVNANNMSYVELERHILQLVSSHSHPFLMQMDYCFQDKFNVYFGTEYLAGGDLFHHIACRTFPDKQNRLWVSEMVLGIEFLHTKNIVHRDLKLDNIMLTADGHVKIVDFGLCKDNMNPLLVTYTYCGTIMTIAPEIIEEKGYTKDVDWWSLGVIIFEMYEAEPPFNGATTKEIVAHIVNEEPRFTCKETPDIAKDLISRLLQKDPTKRIGHGEPDGSEIRKHAYFKDMDWKALIDGSIPSTFEPGDNLSNFDATYTDDPVMITRTGVVPEYEKFFANFH